LSACSPPPEAPIVTRIERVVVAPPAEHLVCDPEPIRSPATSTSQDALADWIAEVTIAGRSCRDRLGVVRKFVEDSSK
jgi:hypothetical protein